MSRSLTILLLALFLSVGHGLAADTEYTSNTTIGQATINADWMEKTVSIGASGGVSTTVTVAGPFTGGPPTRRGGQLGIYGGDGAAGERAELRLTHTGTLTLDQVWLNGSEGVAAFSITETDAEVHTTGWFVLEGARTTVAGEVNGTAQLTVDKGKLVIAPSEENQAQGLRLHDGQIAVSNGGSIETGNFIMGYQVTAGDPPVIVSSEAVDNSVTVTSGGSFRVTDGRYVAVITNGAFNVTDTAGEVHFEGGANVRLNGVMNLDGVGLFTLGEGKALTVGEAGTLAIKGATTIGDGVGTGVIDNQANGTLTVDAAAVLTADLIASAGQTHFAGDVAAIELRVSGGVTTIDKTVTLSSSDPAVVATFGISESGAVTVNDSGVVDTAAFVQTGGSLDLAGELHFGQGAVSGGVVNNTGVVTGGTLQVSGGTVNLIVDGATTVDEFIMSGGSGDVYYDAGHQLAVNNRFQVSNGRLYLKESHTTPAGAGGSAFGGGEVYLQNEAKLTVAQTTERLDVGTSFYFESGSLDFNDSVDFRGGGLFSRVSDPDVAVVSMGGNSLSFSRGSTLDISEANLTISNVADFSIDGATIMAGSDEVTRQVFQAAIQGGGASAISVSSKTTVTMTQSLQRRALQAVDAGQEILLVNTDYTNGTASTMSWESNYFTYYYSLRQDGDGFWRLYLTGYSEQSDEEKLDSLLKRWNRHPRVGGHADKLISQKYANNIIGGRRLQVSDEYDTLSRSGQFNVNALADLADRNSTADYDALMLYNGSGLAQPVQAVLSSNRQTINRLGLRNAQVRREMANDGETLECPSLASQFVGETMENRFWATADYLSDRQQWDEGFAGYRYRGRGVTVGLDRIFGDVVAGAAFSYLGGDFKDVAARKSDAEIDTYGFNLYGSYNHPSGVFVTGAVGAAYSDNKITDARLLAGVEGWNNADYNTRSWLAALSFGYDWWVGDNFLITPSIGFSYQSARADDHEQYFTSFDGTIGSGTLAASGVKGHSATIPLELRASYDIMASEDRVLSLNAGGGYAYELNSRGVDGKIGYSGLDGLGRMSIASRTPGRHIWNVGGGAKYMAGRFELGVTYDYSWRNQFSSHSLTGSIGINF